MASNEKIDEGVGSKVFLLEEENFFDRSMLWDLMLRFYSMKGTDAWLEGVVPHFITSNAFIAERYAKIIHGYLSDCVAAGSISSNDPVYIIEIGAGSGKFTFLLLKALFEFPLPAIPLSNLIYVATDFTEENRRSWETHPALVPFIERGCLDTALYDAAYDDRIVLKHSNVVISPDSPPRNPIIVVAIYLLIHFQHPASRYSMGRCWRQSSHCGVQTILVQHPTTQMCCAKFNLDSSLPPSRWHRRLWVWQPETWRCPVAAAPPLLAVAMRSDPSSPAALSSPLRGSAYREGPAERILLQGTLQLLLVPKSLLGS